MVVEFGVLQRYGGCSDEGAYPQALNEADHDRSYAFRWLGLTQEDDFGCAGRGRGGRRSALLWDDREHAGDGADPLQEAVEGRAAAALLLRGGAVRLRGAPASDAVGTPLRRGGAGADPAQGRRPGEDGPARRDDAGADATGWTADRGVGAGRGARSDAGPAQGAPAVAEFPAAPWAQLTLRPLDQDASPLARRTRLCPPGAASGARRDAATDRACRGAVRAAERGDPRTGAAMVAGASGAGDPGAARCVADRRRGDRGRGRLLQPV